MVRGHREGTRRSDGRWQTSRIIGEREKTFISRKGESLQSLKARADREAYESRKEPGRPDMAVSRAVELYLEFRKDAPISAPTLRDDEFIGGRWVEGRFVLGLMREFEGHRIGRLDPIAIDLVLRTWADKPRTAKKVRSFGGRLYKWLMARGWVGRNVFALSTPIRYEPEVWQEPPPAEQFSRSLAECKYVEMRALILLLRWTGIRPKVARTLKWFSLHKEEGRTYILAGGKTRAAKRPHYVPTEAAEAVWSLPRTSEYVFPSPRGEYWSESGLNHAWQDCQRRAGFNPYTIYMLKHVRGSELYYLLGGKSQLVALAMGLESTNVCDKNYLLVNKRMVADLE